MKIIVIGCPGSGKSVLSRRINEILCYPILHLDRVYHTGGKSRITRDELIAKINELAESHDNWIIDGNYISTLELRVKMADTIILFDLPTDICLANVYNRADESLRQGIQNDDIAKGFDHTLTDDFIDTVKNFDAQTKPRIYEILTSNPGKSVMVIHSYKEAEDLYNNIKYHGRPD